MLMVLDFLIFGGATAASAYAIGATVGPNLARIGEALTGQPQLLAPVPLRAERRVVRRWKAGPPVSARLREAA